MQSGSELSELEKRARTGDRAAFSELIRRYDHELRGVVWTVLESSSATDDVMQSAYLKAFRAIRSFDGRSSLKTWMHSICYHAAIDHARYSNLRSHEPLYVAAEMTSNHDTEASAMARIQLETALGSLSPAERGMLLLTAGLGFSYDETAEIVGQKRGTVASTVHRVRKNLIAKQAT